VEGNSEDCEGSQAMLTRPSGEDMLRRKKNVWKWTRKNGEKWTVLD
jgi:hypothetical protein